MSGRFECGSGGVRASCALRIVNPTSDACTSPLVGRRDPLGAVLRSRSVDRELGSADVCGHALTEQLARRFTDGGRPRFSSRPARGKYANRDGDRT